RRRRERGPVIRPRAAALALATILPVVGPASAAEGPARARAFLVGPECRVRAEGPVDCDEVTSTRRLRGEATAVQLVVEAGPAPGGIGRREEELFVPVRSRSRGKGPREALPWAAAARPADDTVLGAVADPLVRRAERTFQVPAGARRAFWITIDDLPAGRQAV